ncbi:MAG: metal-dependent hydrolase [bacterium]
MVAGHISLAYAARARWPRAELVALIVATLLPDLADFVLPQGTECRTTCGMYTHAFPAILVLAAGMAVLAWGIWHRRSTALLAGALVLSHVALDLVTGYKRFWLGGPITGINLYQHAAADFVVESMMMTIAWWVLRRSRNPPPWAVHPVTLVLLLVLQGSFDVLNSGGFSLRKPHLGLHHVQTNSPLRTGEGRYRAMQSS